MLIVSVREEDMSYLKPPSRAPWYLTMMTILGAGGGYVWMQGEAGKDRAAAAEANTKAQAAEVKRAELAPKIEKLESEKAELVTAKEELERNVQAKTGELEQLKGTADKLQAQMKEEIAKGDVRPSESGGTLR